VSAAARSWGVRWGRAALPLLVGLATLAWFAYEAVCGSVMGLGGPNLVMQGRSAEFSTARLSTTNVGFGIVPIKAGSSTRYVLRMAFASGSLDGFCLSQTQSILGADFTIRVTSRDGAVDVADLTGRNIQFDVTSLTSTNAPNPSGDGIALRGNVSLGLATQTLTTWQSGGVDVVNPLDAPESFAGINGRLFGIDSDVGDVYNVKGDIYDSVIEGPITIKNLQLEVVPGSAASSGCKALPIVY
jgi:hypothetical protein